MSLKHALLGFLNYQDMTGYQLKKFFDGSVRNFWNASLSQIYPTLGQLKEEGLLTMEIKEQDGTPNAKVYQITEAGRLELERWLTKPLEITQPRSAFLLKVFLGANVEPEIILRQLRQALRNAEQNLKNYRAIENHIQDKTTHPSRRDALYWGLTVDFGIKDTQSTIEWLQESIQKIESLSKNNGGKQK